MNNRAMNVLIVVLFLLFLGKQFLFVVYETEKAVMLKFGEMVESDIPPGLHMKVPFMHEIKKFDARILTIDARPERFLTIEKKAMMVDLFAKWKIIDAAQYYVATGGLETKAQNAIFQRVNEGLYNQFGERTLHEVVSGERDQLMTDLTTDINKTIGAEFGVEVIDVRVKRIDLPDSVSSRVFDRMNSEREREARKHRSEGQELAEGIRADADRQRIVIEAEAFREAEHIRGEGDAKATSIYAAAYNRDPELYSFLRSLQAYRESFGNKSDVLLVDPDSDFFKYLNSSMGEQ